MGMMLHKILRGLVAALALAGVVVSILALRVHNMDPGLAPPCAVTEKFDCGTVNHSRFAVFPPTTFDEDPAAKHVHVPIATLGIIGYGLLFVLAALGLWWAVFQLAQMIFAGACFLSYLEAFVIQKWCIYCLWSQGIITLLLLVTMVALLTRRRVAGAVVA
jgi:vitamin-K-epoxide reductase (warfarin-sensitive)